MDARTVASPDAGAASGGVLVADNALSHPDEVAALRELIVNEPHMATTTIAVGKGELLALRL
jgi:predicted O-methyltransferase YrrM